MKTLKEKSKDARRRVLKMSNFAKSAHVGSALSCIEILCALFEINLNQENYFDKWILSKGHAAMALYATACEYALLDETIIKNYLQNNSELWGHPSKKENFPFIHWSTGALGHGLPVACGMALAYKLEATSKKKILCVLSDGECDEGSNWEAILFANQHKLENLYCIVDYNKWQSFGKCENVMTLEPFSSKWKSFGWDVRECDGHQTEEIMSFLSLKSTNPKVLIAHTKKGKGVSTIEDTLESHYKPISSEQILAFEAKNNEK